MEMAFKARENSDYFIIWATFDYPTDEYALFGDLEPIRKIFCFRFLFNVLFRKVWSISMLPCDFQVKNTTDKSNIAIYISQGSGRQRAILGSLCIIYYEYRYSYFRAPISLNLCRKQLELVLFTIFYLRITLSCLISCLIESKLTQQAILRTEAGQNLCYI